MIGMLCYHLFLKCRGFLIYQSWIGISALLNHWELC